MRRPARWVAWLPLAAAFPAMNGAPSAAPAPVHAPAPPVAQAPRAGSVALPLDPAASRLTFTIHRPGESIEGTAGRFEGEVHLDPADLSRGAGVALRVVAVSLETGNRMRDGKMRKAHLEVERFPEIVFRSTSIQVKERKALVEGTLALHGVERSLIVPVAIRYDNGLFTAEGSVTLTYSDYGIPIPRFLWLVMDDAIEVRFRFVAGPAPR